MSDLISEGRKWAELTDVKAEDIRRMAIEAGEAGRKMIEQMPECDERAEMLRGAWIVAEAWRSAPDDVAYAWLAAAMHAAT